MNKHKYPLGGKPMLSKEKIEKYREEIRHNVNKSIYKESKKECNLKELK